MITAKDSKSNERDIKDVDVSALDHILEALLLYQSSSNEVNEPQSSKELMSYFFDSSLTSIMDEYIEIISDDKKLEELRKRVTNEITCDPNDCPFITQFFQELSTSSEDHFYITFMNTVHCNLFNT